MFAERCSSGPSRPMPKWGGGTGEQRGVSGAWAVLCISPLQELQTAEGRVIHGFGLNYRPTDPDYLSRNLYN
jgi:hypothetical protein